MGRKKKITQETVVLKAPEIIEEEEYIRETTPIADWKLRLLQKKITYIEQLLFHVRDELNGIEHNFFHEDDSGEGH